MRQSHQTCIFSFTPIMMSHQLTGYDVTNPHSIAICIMNQAQDP
jgi:hypothetical protein